MPLIEEAVFPLLHIFASFFKDKVPKVLEFISGLSILLHWVFQFKNWYVSPSVYVIFDFFHQCLIVFFIQLFVHLFLDILLLMLPWWMELIIFSFRFLLLVYWNSMNFCATGNQLWIFIGRTDAEAEEPIFWPAYVKSTFTGKDPNAGKNWGQDGKGATEDEMVGWHY